jgi:putative acetyltransferase
MRAMSEPSIRAIEPRDDAAVASIIRTVMPEFGASGQGFAIHDPEVDAMSRAYAPPRAGYFVVELDGRVQGGAGFAQLLGGEATTCELKKMYFLPALRGRGVGRAALERVLAAAKLAGYRRCYLETFHTMHAARRLYEAAGFEKLCGPEGATGHFGCDAWYAKDL